MVFNRTNEGPQIIGWAGTFEGLGEPEQLLAAFFSASNVGLSIIDTQLRYIAINKALADMNGIPADAHLGKSLRDVLGDAAERLEPILHRVVLTGKPVMNVAVALQLPTRREVGHWVVHYFPMNDSSGKVCRIGVVVMEVTEQKKLEERLCRLAGELQQEKNRLKMLMEISVSLNRTPDLRYAFPSISGNIRRVMQCDWIDVSILEESSESIRLYVVDSTVDLRRFGSDLSIPLSDSLCAEAISERRPKVLSSSMLAAIHSPLVDQLVQTGIQSACCMPFVSPKGVIGSFNVASMKDHPFSSDDVDLLKQIGMQLANTLDSTFAYPDIDLKNDSPKAVNVQTGIHPDLHFRDIVGDSPALQRVLKQVKTVAPTDATVLILGETGTGKELIARAIHHMSFRKGASFIKLNCAAIPSGLLESELYGYEKGAFTGALTTKIGRLEVADQGTLFLDEIGDFPLELQPKLLRVLQDQEFERLGSNRTIRVNIRLLAATNRDLAQRVGEGRLRVDLFYRLNVFPVRMPLLGERRGDIPLLVRYFVQKHARRMSKTIKTIPADAMHALSVWEWPGNIRELENFIEKSVILSEGPVLNVPLTELRRPASQSSAAPGGVGREYILRVLRETKGLIEGPGGAAAKLKMKPAVLRAIILRMNIVPKNYQN
jgi:formate hydrogenlyase transcriptional activator